MKNQNIKLQNDKTLWKASSVNLASKLAVVAMGLGLVACGSSGSKPEDQAAFFSDGLKSIKGVAPAQLSSAEENSLKTISSDSESEVIDENGDVVWETRDLGASSFHHFGDFLKSVSKSASSKLTSDDVKVSTFDLRERVECQHYSSIEEMKGLGDAASKIKADYNKKVVTENGVVKESASFLVGGSGSIKYENCRTLDWDTEHQLLNIDPNPNIDEQWTKIDEQWTKISELNQELYRVKYELLWSIELEDDQESLKESLNQSILQIEAQIKDLYEEIAQKREEIHLEHERLEFLRSENLLSTSQNRNGEIKADFKVSMTAKADREKRKDFYEMEDPWESESEEDLRLANAMNHVEGLLQAQFALAGSVQLDAFDSEKNVLVPAQVAAQDLILAVQFDAKTLQEFVSVMESGMLDLETKKKEVRDILEASILCAGGVVIDTAGNGGKRFDCAALIQRGIQEMIDEME